MGGPMSSSRVTADYEQIQQFRSTLATFLEETRESWGSLRTRLAELESDGWAGDSTVSFREIFDEVDASLGHAFEDIEERHLGALDEELRWLEDRPGR